MILNDYLLLKDILESCRQIIDNGPVLLEVDLCTFNQHAGPTSTPKLLKNEVNKELKNADLPDEIRVGAVLRDDKFILPSSKYIFQKDDTVVLLAKRDQLPLVENLFRISSI